MMIFGYPQKNTWNVIHSESLDAAKETIQINEMVHSRVINSLHDRLMELED